MKRNLSIILLLTALLLLLSSCGARDMKIDKYEWKMKYALCEKEGEVYVPAVGEEMCAYPDAKVVDVILTASDGKITVTDSTNGETYEGTYRVSGTTPDGTNYEITIGGKTGHCIVAMTEYYRGEEEPTLPINIDGYSLYFYAE